MKNPMNDSDYADNGWDEQIVDLKVLVRIRIKVVTNSRFKIATHSHDDFATISH